MQRLPRLARRKVLAAFGAAASVPVLAGCAIRPSQTVAPLGGLVGSLDGYRVEQVMPAVAGAIPVLMRTPDGTRFQVDVMRRDEDGHAGVANTATYSLYLSNGGAGDRPSGAAEVRGAHLLAQRLTQIEAERGLPEARGLLTLSERLASHRQAVLKPWT